MCLLANLFMCLVHCRLAPNIIQYDKEVSQAQSPENTNTVNDFLAAFALLSFGLALKFSPQKLLDFVALINSPVQKTEKYFFLQTQYDSSEHWK